MFSRRIKMIGKLAYMFYKNGGSLCLSVCGVDFSTSSSNLCYFLLFSNPITNFH